MKREKTYLRTPEFLVMSTGGLSAALGLIVIFGWHTHSTTLVQVAPTFVPMYYNTALGLLLCGIGLVSIALGRSKMAIPGAALACAIGLLTLVEYVFTVEIGIDQLLMKDYLGTEASHPGRMAPNTALSIALAGAGLLLMSRQARFRQRPVVLGLWGSISVGFGAVALFSYLTGTVRETTFMQLPHMSFHAAVGIVVLGIGLISFAWRDGKETGAPRWLLIYVGIITVTLWLWQALLVQQRTELERKIKAQAASLKLEIEARARSQIQSLVRMVQQRGATRVAQREDWEQDVRRFLSRYTAYQAVGWIEPSFQELWTLPEQESKAVYKENFTLSRRSALEMARVRREAILSRSVNLSDGGKGVLVVVPVFRAENLVGFVTGLVRLQEMLDPISKNERLELSMAVLDGDDLLYSSHKEKGLEKVDWVDETHIDLYGVSWRVRVWPAPEVLEEARSPLLESALLLGLLIASLLAVESTIRKLEKDITERKQAERDLQVEKAYLENLLESAPEAVVVVTNDSTILRINSEFTRMFGYSLDEVVGRSIDELLAPSGLFDEAVSITRQVSEGSNVSHETVRRRKDGRSINVSILGAPIKVDGGQIAVYGIYRDITERKRTEESLQRRDAILEAVSFAAERFLMATNWEESIQEVIARLGTADGVSRVYIFENHIGDEETLLTSQRFEWVAPGITPQIDNPDLQGFPWHSSGFGRWLETMSEGKVIQGHVREFPEEERRILAAQDIRSIVAVPIFVGSEWWGFIGFDECEAEREWSPAELEALKTAAGTLGATIQRKRAEEEMTKLVYALKSISESVTITDMEDTILFVNDAFVKTYGYQRHELIEKKITVVRSENNPAHLVQEILPATLKGGWQGELINRRKNGDEFPVYLSTSMIRDEQGQAVALVGVATDITEKKKLEAQVFRTQRIESIGALASGIAHDLNNVLAPILISLRILKRKLPDEQSQEILGALESSARRGTDMVSQVLTFARGMEGKRVALQPPYLIREMENIAKETFPKSIQIRTEIPKDFWTVWGDTTQLHQVLMNLCVNARDAMPDGGSLTMTAENMWLDENYVRMNAEAKAGPYVVITVEDTGMGIPAGAIDKIFEPFFSTKEIGKGTGLGLSTVLGIVKGHGGFVNVYSEEGKGSRFKVYLPAAETVKTREAEAQGAELPMGHGELILVVDDETSIRDILKETLQTCGYKVITANDGSEALALYSKKRGEIGMVLTDLMMPRLQGPETIRKLQEMDPQVNIVAMSGLMTGGAGTESEGSSVRAYLQKPFTAEKLLRTLDEVLHSG